MRTVPCRKNGQGAVVKAFSLAKKLTIRPARGNTIYHSKVRRGTSGCFEGKKKG